MNKSDIPDNHTFLINSFSVPEIKKILNLLQTHSTLFPSHLQSALHSKDFDSVLKFLMSEISTGYKEIFIPYYLPASSKFKLEVSRDPLSVQILSNQEIVVPALEHIEIQLNLQILNFYNYDFY